MEFRSQLSDEPGHAEACFEAEVARAGGSAGRDSVTDLGRKAESLSHVPLLAETLNAMPYMVIVLNEHRQIVAANDAVTTVLKASVGEVTGKRPGEAVGCIWAKDGPDGCGTGEHCPFCGALRAVIDSRTLSQRIIRECRVLASRDGETIPLDLRVTATPFAVNGDSYVVLAVEDISQAKRLSVLQRTFFHDVLNTAGCIQGYMRFLERDDSVRPEMRQRLANLTSQIVAEIQAQRDLLAAEAGDYRANPAPLRTGELLESLCTQYQGHTAAADRNVVISSGHDEVIFSDRLLLLRILGNMVKNALEATDVGGTVAVGCEPAADHVVFTVHNPEGMPQEVQMQVFQRSFSTKGESGRGIGTYSMKLFGERYLDGKVHFTSSPTEGTIFSLTLPKRLASSEPAAEHIG